MFLSVGCLAQNQMYIHTYDNYTLYTIDVDNCKLTVVGDMPDIMYDIAISPAGQLYGFSSKSELYRLDKNTGNGVIIAGRTDNFVMNALVYGPDDWLYAADLSGGIFRINPVNGQYNFLGYCGFQSGGDLTFYENKLYLSDRSSNLIEINLNDVGRSKNIGRMNYPDVFGIITVGEIDCKGAKSKVYATADNAILELDIKTAQVKKICSLPINHIGGAASLSESSKVVRRNAGTDTAIDLCQSDTDKNLSQYLLGEKGGEWYEVNNQAFVASTETLRPQQRKAGQYVFAYTIGEGLCRDTATVRVQILPLPVTKQINITNASCQANNGKIEIITPEVSPEFVLNGTTRQPSNTFSGLKSGTYTVSIINNKGCRADTSVTVPSAQAPPIDKINIQLANCQNTNGQLSIISPVPGLTYSIDTKSFQRNNVFSGLPAGTYTVQVRDANLCISSQTVTIGKSDTPVVAGIQVTNARCNNPDGAFRFSVSGGVLPYSYSLDKLNFSTQSEFGNLAEGKYQVTVKDASGCVVTFGVDVLSSCGNDLYIPDAFSPNADGINDNLRVFSSATDFVIQHLTIYDRWGNIVHSVHQLPANSQTILWDGRHKQEFVMSGVYPYVLGVEFKSGERKQYSSTIQVVR